MPAYRLQTVLEMRERAEEDAKQAFSAAANVLARARQVLRELEEDLERRQRERKARVAAYLDEIMAKGTAGLAEMTLMNRFEQRLKDEEAEVALEIDRQRDEVKSAERQLEQRRVEMAEAAKEKKAIEKHKEKWAAQVHKEREDREELAREEIGTALFLARSRK